MTMHQSQRFCRSCQRNTLHLKYQFSDGWGCLLTLITAGLFLPVWVLLYVVNAMGKGRCQACGTKN